jgi:tetratricopeptide (TPR) repeat protein
MDDETVATGRAVSRVTAAAVVAVLLALPMGYVLLHHPVGQAVQAKSPQAQAAPPNIAALEAAAKSDPSAANEINLSLGYINTGQSGKAVPLLNALTATDPNNSVAWNNLCVAHTLLQEYPDAIAACNRALAAKPDFQLSKNNLAWALGERDKTVKAITQMETTGQDKRDAAFYLSEGLDYMHLGNYAEAIHAWRRTLEMDPKSAPAANDIGIAMMMEKQPAAAIPWFQQAIQLDPTMQLAKNNLAWAQSMVAQKR